jgi:ADP-heptose:LPS heptosyltransferase
MGYGDEFMATALAFDLHQETGKQVVIVDRNGRQRWSAVFDNLPFLARVGHLELRPVGGGSRDDFSWLKNAPRCRHYLEHDRCTSEAWAWKETGWLKPPRFKAWEEERRDRIALKDRPIVFMEPHIKPKASPNKAWPWENWVRLVNLIKREVYIAQFSYGQEALPWAWQVPSVGMRDATAWLQSSADVMVVGACGLMHAAAAVNVPSVVLYGGFVSPTVTGYEENANIFTGGTACGMKITCDHCTEAMARITPEEVAEHVLRIAARKPNADARDQAPRI